MIKNQMIYKKIFLPKLSLRYNPGDMKNYTDTENKLM